MFQMAQTMFQTLTPSPTRLFPIHFIISCPHFTIMLSPLLPLLFSVLPTLALAQSPTQIPTDRLASVSLDNPIRKSPRSLSTSNTISFICHNLAKSPPGNAIPKFCNEKYVNDPLIGALNLPTFCEAKTFVRQEKCFKNKDVNELWYNIVAVKQDQRAPDDKSQVTGLIIKDEDSVPEGGKRVAGGMKNDLERCVKGVWRALEDLPTGGKVTKWDLRYEQIEDWVFSVSRVNTTATREGSEGPEVTVDKCMDDEPPV
ncbi:hypothetical protein P154DRAFT_94436 [Amniculicola lignicola CBS 123094]|uniref:Uncharacterized protein n=1 Tax=Amniculicola lignicola CBS 123094 TaxID=1392246 RepID=A0A6A5WP29_9PLEO|nr:hypothetical protein P154DRAFT_94436 [Amniculicola lignicola CBS 123094]